MNLQDAFGLFHTGCVWHLAHPVSSGLVIETTQQMKGEICENAAWIVNFLVGAQV